MTEDKKSRPNRWELSFDTVVSVGSNWGSGLEIMIERQPNNSVFDDGMARLYNVAARQSETDAEAARIFKFGFDIGIEDIPRFTTIMNEIFKLYYEDALEEIRSEEESITGDNEERVARLKAYRVFGDTIADAAEKLGVFRTDLP